MKHTYSVEALHCERWGKLFGSETRDFCAGYLSHAQYCHPRLAHRIVRSDGKVVHEMKADSEVHIGMVASWPTPEQYEEAAKRALEQAARIREQAAKQEERRLARVSFHA
jgi:hypothetical protein